MHFVRNVCGLTTVLIALAIVAPNALAQEASYSETCQYIGGPPKSEPLGDRDGHSLSSVEVSCVVNSGLLSGGIGTNSILSEFNGPNGVLLMGGGVIRKPGATLVFELTEQKIALTVTDGKVTGASVNGRGKVLLGTGAAASLAGKTFSYTIKPGPPGQFTIETTYD
jgi:hypothetical protein